MNPKRYLIAISFLLPVMAGAADPEPGALLADLDGDGKSETISWVKFAKTEDQGDFYQIRVSDDDGTLLWEGPKATDAENPLVFGNWDFGYSLPELAADIDGDGAVEMIAPAPQSDVSPTWFRVLRWKGGRFVPARSGNLLESPRGSGRFPWSQTDKGQGTWISSFKKENPDGSFRVGVFEYVGGVTPRTGVAVVSRTPKGYQVRKWISPLKALTDMPSPEPDGTPSNAGVVVYRARLGARDHFNSTGKRLGNVSGILRQDRANYHKGKGDDDDGPDPVFRTANARNGMDARRPVAVGTNTVAWRKAIVNGSPLVEVEVTDKELKVRIITP